MYRIVTKNGFLDIKRESNYYSIIYNGKKIDVDHNDFYRMLHYGINRSTDIRNGRYSVSITIDNGSKSEFIKSQPKYSFDIIGLVDNSESMSISFDKNEIKKFIDIIDNLSKIDNAPYSPGEKLWMGVIGFEDRNGNWTFFNEPFQVEVDSVYEIDENRYAIRFKYDSQLSNETVPTLINITYDNGKQIDNLMYICDKDKEIVMEKILDVLENSDHNLDNISKLLVGDTNFDDISI